VERLRLKLSTSGNMMVTVTHLVRRMLPNIVGRVQRLEGKVR
jgi:hypothetical protein